METMYWKVQSNENKIAIKEAASLLVSGELVAFPTETVYGLGADATNPKAVSKIFQAKGRPQDNPLIAHVANRKQLEELVTHVPEYVDKLIRTLTPGPLTFVLPSNGTCAHNVTAGLSTVAVRIPDHPAALAIIEATSRPIAAPSANLSGKPSPTTAKHVQEDLDGKIAGIVDGGPTGVGLESTVLDCTKDEPVILRPGGVTRDEIDKVLGLNIASMNKTNPKHQPMSPGMKYKHYAPEVPLWLIEGEVKQIQAVIKEEQKKGKRVGLLASKDLAEKLEADDKQSLGDSIDTVAAQLYDGLRYFKQTKVDLIICEAFPEKGIGQAVMNRLKKAATRSINLSTRLS